MCLAKYFDNNGDGIPWCSQWSHSDIANRVEKADCKDCFKAVQQYYYNVYDRWKEVGGE